MFSSKIILNQQQIEAVNRQNLQCSDTGLTDLVAVEPEQVLQELEILLSVENLPQEPRYDKEGNLYGEDFL